MSNKSLTNKERINELQIFIDSLESQLFDARLELATLLCPYKVGDKIRAGWSRGKKSSYIVEGIYPKYDGYKMDGRRLKKDGSPSRISREISDFMEIELVEDGES